MDSFTTNNTILSLGFPEEFYTVHVHDILPSVSNEFLSFFNGSRASWCPCDEPANFEHGLLRQYLKEHDELPPFNRADIRRLYKSVVDQESLGDSITVIKTKGNQTCGIDQESRFLEKIFSIYISFYVHLDVSKNLMRGGGIHDW